MKDRFKIEYRLLSLQETYGQDVLSDYHLGMPPEYFVDAEIDFYYDEKKFFSDDSFCIYKFVKDASFWFNELFPNCPFIWNEKRFDGCLGSITIQPQSTKTLFKISFDDAEDKKEEVEVHIPTKIFSCGFSEFVNGFKKEVESFWGMSFDLL
ncbi:MAG: hypothetical protein AAF383_14450 [Cyanobacteria bacterium P01_A01_bin.83]